MRPYQQRQRFNFLQPLFDDHWLFSFVLCNSRILVIPTARAAHHALAASAVASLNSMQPHSTSPFASSCMHADSFTPTFSCSVFACPQTHFSIATLPLSLSRLTSFRLSFTAPA